MYLWLNKNAEANKEGEEKMAREVKKLKSFDAVERERERATSREVSFICAAKNNLNRIDYKTEIKKLRLISAL